MFRPAPARNALAATAEPAWVRRTLIGITLAFLALFLFVPLLAVFFNAFKTGVDVDLAAITEADARLANVGFALQHHALFLHIASSSSAWTTAAMFIRSRAGCALQRGK